MRRSGVRIPSAPRDDGPRCVRRSADHLASFFARLSPRQAGASPPAPPIRGLGLCSWAWGLRHPHPHPRARVVQRCLGASPPAPPSAGSGCAAVLRGLRHPHPHPRARVVQRCLGGLRHPHAHPRARVVQRCLGGTTVDPVMSAAQAQRSGLVIPQAGHNEIRDRSPVLNMWGQYSRASWRKSYPLGSPSVLHQGFAYDITERVMLCECSRPRA